MRLHPMTRAAVNSIILKHKPSKFDDNSHEPLEFDFNENTPQGKIQSPDNTPEAPSEPDLYYYGLLMMNHTVITIFKN